MESEKGYDRALEGGRCRGAVGECCGGRGQERGDGVWLVMLRRSKLLRRSNSGTDVARSACRGIGGGDLPGGVSWQESGVDRRS